jgi:hypothetical protein
MVIGKLDAPIGKDRGCVTTGRLWKSKNQGVDFGLHNNFERLCNHEPNPAKPETKIWASF